MPSVVKCPGLTELHCMLELSLGTGSWPSMVNELLHWPPRRIRIVASEADSIPGAETSRSSSDRANCFVWSDV